MEGKRCVLITGASSNIGQGIAVSLAKRGYDIAFSYSENREGAEDTIRLCEPYGGRIQAFQAQLDEADGPEKLVEEVYAAFGRIDALVSNAGRSFHKSVLSITRKEMEDICHLDFRGYMLCAKAVAKHMIRDGIQGCIVFISSSQGDQAYPGGFLYCGVKAAIKQACKSLAMDLSHYGIRVNVVAPGAIRSYSSHPSPKKVRMHAERGTPEKAWEKVEDLNERPFTKGNIPMHRVGEPSDIGEAVSYLISDGASYVTGITIRVDGGLILPGILHGEEPFAWVDDGYWEKQRMLANQTTDPQKEEQAVKRESEDGKKHTVVVTDRTENELEALTGALVSHRISTVPFEDYEHGIAIAHQKYGQIDQLLVDYVDEQECSVINATPEFLDMVFEKGFVRYALAVRKVAEYMIEDHVEGNIILIFRNHGRRALPSSFADSAIDAALEHAVRCIAIDLGHYGIRVNGVAVNTGIAVTNERNIPLKTKSRMNNLCGLIGFLSDAAAACTTGDTMYADYATSIPTASEAEAFVPWCTEDYWKDAFYKAFGENVKE